jgi:hypothetical protein
MLRVQKEIPVAALPGIFGSNLGLPDTPATKTGTNCLIDIFKTSGILIEKDGKFSLASHPEDDGSANSTIEAQPKHSVETAHTAQTQAAPQTATPAIPAIPIHVNIELHLPASSEQAVYDALFKSIRENLLK